MDVKQQLAIWLYRAGRYSDGASVDEVASFAGVSIGSVYNCTWRCIVALLSLHDSAFNLNDQEQKAGAQAYAHEKSGCSAWRHGKLAVDGTPIGLFSKPGWYGEEFFGKDKIYAIQLTVSIALIY